MRSMPAPYFARRALCVAALAACTSCSESAIDQVSQPVVYGTDDRTDVYAHPSAELRALAQRSIVALMYSRHVDASNPMSVTFPSRTLAVKESLCAGERFAEDPTAAYCSGTLIDDDLVLTAGHCVETAAECADTKIAFNYYRDSATSLAPATSEDIFQCASIVTRENRTLADGTELDYEIIRIDRAAAPRFAPASVRRHGVVAMGQPIAVIGFGSGIPAKIDSGGSVTDPRAGFTDYFDANTDTFGGNSGSGVFDLGSNELIGVLVRGATDYVERSGCFVVNQCAATPGAADCDGESISHVQRALDDFCAHNTSARLCPTPDGGTDADSGTDASNDAASERDASSDASVSSDAASDAIAPSADASDDRAAIDAIANSDASASSDAANDGSTGTFIATGGCHCHTGVARTQRAPWAMLALLATASALSGRRDRGRCS